MMTFGICIMIFVILWVFTDLLENHYDKPPGKKDSEV